MTVKWTLRTTEAAYYVTRNCCDVEGTWLTWRSQWVITRNGTMWQLIGERVVLVKRFDGSCSNCRVSSGIRTWRGGIMTSTRSVTERTSTDIHMNFIYLFIGHLVIPCVQTIFVSGAVRIVQLWHWLGFFCGLLAGKPILSCVLEHCSCWFLAGPSSNQLKHCSQGFSSRSTWHKLYKQTDIVMLWSIYLSFVQ